MDKWSPRVMLVYIRLTCKATTGSYIDEHQDLKTSSRFVGQQSASSSQALSDTKIIDPHSRVLYAAGGQPYPLDLRI